MTDRPLPPSSAPPALAWPELAAWDPQESDAERPLLAGVALAVVDPDLRDRVVHALAHGDLVVLGEDAAHLASIVVTDAPQGGRRAVASLRARTRGDAAIVAVFGAADAPTELDAAYDAGAAACVRHPFVERELVTILKSIVDSQSTKERLDDLARQLDVQAHLASVGRATSGIGHELTNPLAVVTAAFEALRGETLALLEARDLLAEAVRHGLPEPTAGAARELLEERIDRAGAVASLDEMEGALGRIRDVLQTVRDFSREGADVRVQPADVSKVVASALAWTERDLAGVEMEQVIDEGVVALADPTLLSQVVVNLVTNAANAARQLSSPRVRVHVHATGTTAIVSVRDNGPGIPAEVRDRIFEPFFTTRRGQGGTGLGLALCREYALRMGARITLWTARGRGARFRLHMRRPASALSP